MLDDKDLDLYIRDNYINVYYKGNSLLKLAERSHGRYRVTIHRKFLQDMEIPDLVDEHSTAAFLSNIPALKENIIRHGRTSLELEYEQLIIRANNRERRNNSDYFIVDRQYAIGRYGIDLMGFYWGGARRRQGDIVQPCLMEVKFALNTDIAKVHEQIERYYDLVKADPAGVAEDLEQTFRQRLDLGMYDQAPARLEAMKTLKFAREIERFQFVLMLVDYNPFSKQLDLRRLADLPFAGQVKVFFGGFAMWETELGSVDNLPN